MSSLTREFSRVSWLVVPIAAYLAITLAFPIANGAAHREDFARHASIVVGACLAAIAMTIILNTLTDALRRRL